MIKIIIASNHGDQTAITHKTTNNAQQMDGSKGRRMRNSQEVWQDEEEEERREEEEQEQEEQSIR